MVKLDMVEEQVKRKLDRIQTCEVTEIKNVCFTMIRLW